MKNLGRYLKPYIPVLLAVVTLLAIRAQVELALPAYTSNIVDVGISQSGIETLAPEVMRESFFEQIAPLAEDKQLFTDSYKLIDRTAAEYDRYVKKYPVLATENVYILDTSDQSVIDGISADFTKAAMIMIAAGGEQTAGQTPLDLLKAEYEAVGIDLIVKQTGYILRVGGMMLLMLLISLTVILGETFLTSRMAAGVGRNMRRDVFKKVTSFSNTEFDKFSTASLITRSTDDITQIQQILFMFMRFVVYSPMIGIGAVIKVVNSKSGMSWVLALAVSVVSVLTITIFSLVMPKFKIMQKLMDRLNLVARESLTGMMVIRAFNTEGYEEKKFAKANGDIRSVSLFVNRVFAFMHPLMMVILNGTTLLIIWVGAHKVDMGLLQVGAMIAFTQYAMRVIQSFTMLTMIVMNLPRSMVSVNRVSEVLDTDSSITDPKQDKAKAFDKKLKGVVEFKNVSFKYPNAEDYVLRDLSFTARPGETTAFIGSTGSGKSTVVNLIPRFYDVTEGCVLVDGADVRNVKQKDLRKKIGYVPQKGLLFSGTIESNIKFGSTGGNVTVTDDDMIKAAEIAQAKSFIEDKTDKYFDPIAQAGANVSGGQKQRLSIARAIAKKPDIFIFDDSFSALDYKTDATLRKALAQNLSNSTNIIVAQRIGTIKNAEQIIVLDEGKVVGMGRHGELLKNCDVYRQIALSQLSPKELGMDGGTGEGENE